MKRIKARTFAVILMMVFVYFVTANTIFMHTHRSLDGIAVTHSHPYSLPSHSHSSQSFSAISAFNLDASLCNGTAAALITEYQESVVSIEVEDEGTPVILGGWHAAMRAPPIIV